MPLRALALVALLCAAAPALADDPFVHVQTDRGVYRLGDVVRWRVHRPDGEAPISLELRGPDGQVAATAEATGPTPSGTLAIDPARAGGAWRLVATVGGRVVHEVPVGVFDVAPRRLALSLRVLSDVVYPGQPLVAAFQAKTLEGEPLAGLTGKARATFGDVAVEASVGPTDADGACVVRLVVPAAVRVNGGHLAVAVEAGRGKTVDAVARPVQVSASVGRVDAFVEGGAIVEGAPHRLALLARDLDGRPVRAEGRVEDDEGRVVALFVADGRGQALVEVPYAAGRRYRAAIDRPANVERTFPLPGPTGHARALRLERSGTALVVHVHGEPGTARVELVAGGQTLARAGVDVTKAGGAARLALRGGPWAVGHVLVGDGERVTHLAPVLLGDGWPTTLAVTPRERPRAGAPIVLQVAATRVGPDGVVLPVEGEVAVSVAHAALWEDLAAELVALSARRLLHGHLEGPLSDVGALFTAGAPVEAREALLAIRAGRQVDAAGVPLAAARRLELPRLVVPAMEPRPAAPLAQGATTAARGTALDAALLRAPFTRAAAPRVAADVALEPVDPRQALAVAARPERDLPQEARLPASRVDRRDVLCWAPVVRLGKDGKGTITLRAGDEVEALAVVALGSSAGATPLGATTRLAPVAPFEPVAALPDHLRVGDVAELELGCEVADGLPAPVAVKVDLPPGVRALGPTEWVRTPTGAKSAKLRVEAVAPTTGALLRLVATRGPLRVVRRASLSVSHAAVERAVSCSGAGSLSLGVQVPATAIAGSVVTRARVTGSATASALDGLESMLTEPHGCFEQTTSTNDPNLAVLEALLERGDDAVLLERAWALAEAGHTRILTFQDASGGFSLWPGAGAPAVRYTALGVWQLGRYARLTQGKGLEPMRRAIAWLDAHEAKGPEAALAALATIEAGVPWAGARAALGRAGESPQEAALVADALAAWGAGEPPAALEEVAARLVRLQAPDGRIPARGEGPGVLGAAGDLLDVEVTAHAAIGLLGAGALDPARRACEFLARRRDARGGWGSTQSTVQALRAFVRLERALPRQDGRATAVTLAGGGGAPALGRLPAGSPRPLLLARALDVAPGRRAQVELSVGEAPPALLVTLACAWRDAGATSAPDASYALRTSLPQVVPTGGALDLMIALEPLRAVQGGGQVVARIGLPGGCRLDPARVGDWLGQVSRHEVEGGALVLYFEAPPGPVHLRVPLLACVAGTFATGPSQVAPYYEADRAGYAPGRTLKVITGYDDDPGSLGR